jgi:hypothetical protein
MGRGEPGGYSVGWTPPKYTVAETGKVVGGYQPAEPHNWGRWGDDDQRGTQNLIGPAERVAAAQLVRTGKAFSLALPIDRTAPSLSSRPAPMLLPTSRASSGTTTCCRCRPRAPPSGTPSAT